MATFRKFIAGAVLLYAGFILFFLGFMITATQSMFFDVVTSQLIPLDLGTTLRAEILQLLGGLVCVTGFILCISPAKPPPLPPPPPPTIVIQKVPEPAVVTASSSGSGSKCKFCNAPMELATLFCPSCRRAQA